MKQHLRTITTFFFLITLISINKNLNAQAPTPALIGYWQNWNDANAPYIQLNNIDSRYNIVNVSFAVPHSGTDYKMEFIPDQVSQTTLINQIQTLHSQGRKVIISIGGATSVVKLSTIAKRDTFVNTMVAIINTYDFDGIDLDLEGSSVSVSGGTIANPTDASIINLIYAVKQIMSVYYTQHGHRLILTMAPETAFVQGGQSAYGGIWGAYLPIIHALRDSLEILYVQLYNSGSMYGIDGNIYAQGTADFIVAMTEAIIHGFNTAGGFFTGLPANKVAIGLPACANAAGGGFVNTANVKAAIDYLRGNGIKPGSYTLNNASGYPTLRGMMTWSVNWDAVGTCGAAYEYATNYQNIFGGSSCTPCPVPVNLTTTAITSSSAKLNWQVNNCATGYRIRYRQTGTSAWIIKTININTGLRKVTGLTSSTQYQWQVKTECSLSPLVWSAWSSIKNFTTSPPRFGESTENETSAITLNIFPNPTQNFLNISLTNVEPDSKLIIRNVMGQIVYQSEITDGGDVDEQIDVSELTAAVYVLTIVSESKTASGVFVKK
ncbi:MAG: glycosyl hydrolase family 18 protein [Bacteroidia bacterium]